MNKINMILLARETILKMRKHNVRVNDVWTWSCGNQKERYLISSISDDGIVYGKLLNLKLTPARQANHLSLNDPAVAGDINYDPWYRFIKNSLHCTTCFPNRSK